LPFAFRVEGIMAPPQEIAAAVAVAGFGLLFISHYRAKKAEKTLCDGAYEVEEGHIAFLQEMVQKYKIPSIDKAVRALIQYSREANKDDLFVKKRCNTCGGKKNKKILAIKIYGAQKEFLQEMQEQHKVKTLDKTLRCILEFAQRDGDRDEMFKVIRCKTCS